MSKEKETTQPERQLTNEEILRVFAMYWGAKYVTGNVKTGGEFNVNGTNLELIERENKFRRLYLTPLSAITDEHAFLLCDSFCVSYDIDSVEFIKEQIHEYISNYDDRYYNYDLSAAAFQVLVNLGYAVRLEFSKDHWANGLTAIELNIAIGELPTHSKADGMGF